MDGEDGCSDPVAPDVLDIRVVHQRLHLAQPDVVSVYVVEHAVLALALQPDSQLEQQLIYLLLQVRYYLLAALDAGERYIYLFRQVVLDLLHDLLFSVAQSGFLQPVTKGFLLIVPLHVRLCERPDQRIPDVHVRGLIYVLRELDVLLLRQSEVETVVTVELHLRVVLFIAEQA